MNPVRWDQHTRNTGCAPPNGGLKFVNPRLRPARKTRRRARKEYGTVGYKKNGPAARSDEPESAMVQMEMVSATSSSVVSMLLCMDRATLMSKSTILSADTATTRLKMPFSSRVTAW